MKLWISALAAVLFLVPGLGAAVDDPWPGAHNRRSEEVKETTENSLSRELVHNPELLKEMMKRRETRQQILQDRDMMRQMMESRELRREMSAYPEMRDRIMRDTDLRDMMDNGKTEGNRGR